LGTHRDWSEQEAPPESRIGKIRHELHFYAWHDLWTHKGWLPTCNQSLRIISMDVLLLRGVFWFHTTSLGLSEDQLTSYNPVSMDWLLAAAPVSIVWFLKGIADSDGCVNVGNRTVEITSEPNGPLFVKLFAKVGIRAKIYKSKGYDCVSIPASEAARIQIFNVQVGTHRSVLLDRVANAQTFPARWPAWLEERAYHLLSEHADLSTVRNILLAEDNTYVKLRTLRNKRGSCEGKPAKGSAPLTPRLRGA